MQNAKTQLYKYWKKTVDQEVRFMFQNKNLSDLKVEDILGPMKFKKFKKTQDSRVGVIFTIVIKKPHWDNNRRIEKVFAKLAEAYKNQSSDDLTVLGKEITGFPMRNSYIIDNPPISHSAKRIEWEVPKEKEDDSASDDGSGSGSGSESGSGSGEGSKVESTGNLSLMLTLIPAGVILIASSLLVLLLNEKTCQLKLCF